MSALTPIERFIEEIPADRRRAFDARQAQAGLKRVTVTVPERHAESLKIIARFLRNTDDEDVDYIRRILEDGLSCDYEALDEDVAAGRWPLSPTLLSGEARPQRSEDALAGERGANP